MDKKNLTKGQISDALNNNEFLFFYQPILSLITGEIDGAEALIRWRHNDEFIQPNEFIPFAERNGQITEITDTMLSPFIADVRKIHDSNASIEVCLNISGQDIQRDDFCDGLFDTIKEHKVDKTKIKLEITETATLTFNRHSMLVVTDLVSNGIKIAIDDFGTGNSTYERLKNLPFTTLKIDNTITSSALSSPAGLTLLDHSVNIAHQLEFNTVAEGIETREQFEYLQCLGCDHLQGYYISRPLELSAFISLVNERRKWEVSGIGTIYKAKVDYCDWLRKTLFLLRVSSKNIRIIDFESIDSPIGKWIDRTKEYFIGSDNDELIVAYKKNHELAKHLLYAKNKDDFHTLNDLLPDFLQSSINFNNILHNLYLSEFKKLYSKHNDS